MRLLICTQVLDANHPVLGFMHGWVLRFSEDFDSISVICLEKGTVELPANVKVISLGKEKQKAHSLVYAIRFWKALAQFSGSYDHVLVHMNPEYVLLGGLYWRACKRKVLLWYNHSYGGLKLFFARIFASKLLHTSPYAATATYSNALRMPAGIDTTVFSVADMPRKQHSIYFQGRISKAKRIDVLLSALTKILNAYPDATITLVGPQDAAYMKDLCKNFNELLDSQRIQFRGPVPNTETPSLYRQHSVSVNLTAAGNFDKSVLESIACGTPAVVSSPAFRDLVPQKNMFVEGDPESLAKTVISLWKLDDLQVSDAELQKIKELHSLDALSTGLAALLRS